MVAISPSWWDIEDYYDASVLPGSPQYRMIFFHRIRSNPFDTPRYWLIWEYETGYLEAYRQCGGQKLGKLQPRKLALAMAHRCGIIPHGRIYTREERPELYQRLLSATPTTLNTTGQAK